MVFTKYIKRIISVALVTSLCVTALNSDIASSENNINTPTGIILTEQETYSLGSGVTEFQIETNNSAGTSPVKSYIAQIDLSKNVTILANYGKYYKSTNPEKWTVSSWSRSRTSSQANRYINATGGEVLVATNGDFYNMGNGKPKGALVINGTTYHDASDRPYFAMLDDGTAVIRDAGSEITSDVMQAVGGSYMSVKDGQITSTAMSANITLTPCNAIGIRGDGSVIIFMVDGRDDDVSVGYTLYDQARMLISLGCVNALCLDCGGSSTFVSKHKDSDSLEIQNNPSDGEERSVASTLMIVKTDKFIEESDNTTPTLEPVTTKKPSSTKAPTSTKSPTATKKPTSTKAPTTTKSSSAATKEANDTFSTSSIPNNLITQTIFSSVKKFKYGRNLYRIISKKNKTVAFCDTVSNKPKKVIIPATVKYQGNTYKVTTIDKKACINNTRLKKVTLGKYITKIKYKAFFKCTSLKKVVGLKRYSKNMTFKKFYKKYVLNNKETEKK